MANETTNTTEPLLTKAQVHALEISKRIHQAEGLLAVAEEALYKAVRVRVSLVDGAFPTEDEQKAINAKQKTQFDAEQYVKRCKGNIESLTREYSIWNLTCLREVAQAGQKQEDTNG